LTRLHLPRIAATPQGCAFPGSVESSSPPLKPTSDGGHPPQSIFPAGTRNSKRRLGLPKIGSTTFATYGIGFPHEYNFRSRDFSATPKDTRGQIANNQSSTSRKGIVRFVNTFALHRAQPQVSYEAYVASRSLELGEWVATKKRIYLDTKFWILLRNSAIGRDSEPAIKSLLERLYYLVESGVAICPLSLEIFREIFAQSDAHTLAACAELIDRLSKGVCQVEKDSRIRIEVSDFIRRSTVDPKLLHPRLHLMWTKARYVLGHFSPEFHDESLKSGGLDLILKKALFDQMWSMNLADLLDVTEGKFRVTPGPDISDELNKGKLENLTDNTSYQKLFLIEIRGILDASRPQLAAAFQQIYRRDTGNDLTDIDLRNDKSGDWLANIVYECFRRNKIGMHMPTLRVKAGLHALTRWDLARKYRRNDCADFRHAASAIPYFDFFLTERSLKALLSDGNLKIRDYSNCIICSTAEEALHALASL